MLLFFLSLISSEWVGSKVKTSSAIPEVRSALPTTGCDDMGEGIGTVL